MMNERDLPAMRRFVEVLAREKHGFEMELLRACEREAGRNVATRLFADAFVRRLDAAVECGEAALFERWLGAASSPQAPLRPSGAVVCAVPLALSRAAREHGFERVAAGLIAQIDACIASARADAVEEPALVDDVDAEIDRLLTQLDERDPLTGEHSRAVAAWSARIGRALGCAEVECRELGRAGLVHDVGKLSVPLSILHAPRTLVESEWCEIRAHTTHGEALIERYEVLRPYRDAIGAHHERLDGSGYPRGLRGRAIGFQARVVAVADAFNAMVGRRPYRSPHTPAGALGELQSEAGTLLDPDIVGALANILSV